jgi:hypothetical protein
MKGGGALAQLSELSMIEGTSPCQMRLGSSGQAMEVRYRWLATLDDFRNCLIHEAA